MILSLFGIMLAQAFRVEVFPDPVPPDIIMFCFVTMLSSKKSAISCVMDLFFNRSFMVNGFCGNFRMVRIAPFRLRGGMIAFMRDPSGSLASTNGVDSSILLPIFPTMRFMMLISCASFSNVILLFSKFPFFSMKIELGPLIMISVISLFCKSGSIGPRPRILNVVLFSSFNNSSCGRKMLFSCIKFLHKLWISCSVGVVFCCDWRWVSMFLWSWVFIVIFCC